MKILKWLTFGLGFLLILIKLIFVSLQQNEFIHDVYDRYSNLTIDEIYRLIIIRQIFIEQFLIIISLSGYFIRKKFGVIFANLYPYFVLGYGVFHIFESTQIFTGFHIGHLTFSIVVILLTNTKSSMQIFGLDYRSSKQLWANLLSLVIASVLILILLSWIRLNA